MSAMLAAYQPAKRIPTELALQLFGYKEILPCIRSTIRRRLDGKTRFHQEITCK